MKLFRIRIMILVALGTALLGCAGYRAGNIGGREIQGVSTVYIPVVKNESMEPGIQVMVTNALIRRFENDGTLQTTKNAEADSELQVVIKTSRRNPTRSARGNTLLTAEYEVSLEAEVTFTNRRLGKKMFSDKVVGRTSFYVQNDLQESERQALPLAAEDLAYNTVKRIVEGW